MVLSSMNAADSTHALTITVKANNRDIDAQIIFLGISLMGIELVFAKDIYYNPLIHYFFYFYPPPFLTFIIQNKKDRKAKSYPVLLCDELWSVR